MHQDCHHYYSVEAVEDEAVEADGWPVLYKVWLGDGECEAPHYADVARLAVCMHRSVSPVTPWDVYRYVTGGERRRRQPLVEDYESSSSSSMPAGGDARDERFRSACLADVAVNLVQWYAERGSADEAGHLPPRTVGHARTCMRFCTREDAKLAVAVDRAHRTATAEDVLRCLSRGLDAPLLTYGVTRAVRLPQEVRCDTVHLPTDDVLSLPTSAWLGLRRDVLHHTPFVHPPRATRLTAAVDDRRAAAAVDVIHHHWRVDDATVLSHVARPGTTLHFHPAALGGGIVELRETSARRDEDYEDEDEERDEHQDLLSQVWVGRERRHIPRRLFLGHVPDERRGQEVRFVLRLALPSGHEAKRVQEVKSQLDKRGRGVVEHWEKSARSKGVLAPTLLDVLPLLLVEDEVREVDGLCAQRALTVQDAHDLGVFRIFKERFREQYAAEAVQRTAREDRTAGVYAVVDVHTQSTVAAFSVVLFDCILSDGLRSVALMVDTFAVAKAAEGKGYGGRVYRSFVCTLAERRVPACPRYVVFAQCIDSGSAADYWVDKLDETREARALVLQVLVQHADRLQVCYNCRPRAREYWESRHLSSP